MKHLAECVESTGWDEGMPRRAVVRRTTGRAVNSRRYLNPMFGKKRRPAGSGQPSLSSGDRETLGEIRCDLDHQGKPTPLSDAEIVDLALRLMRRDIHRGLEAEVLEEVRREADYRQWCVQIDAPKVTFAPAGPPAEDGDSK